MTFDAFAALEEAARKQALEEAAQKAVSQARARLILGKDAPSAFFATLALRLEAIADWSIETANVDGKRLKYNPAWFAGLPADQAKGVIVHEVLHCANKHFARRGQREPGLWNIACDLAINPILVEAGFRLPPARLMPAEVPYHAIPLGKSAEEIYDLLREALPPQAQEPQPQPNGNPGGAGQRPPAPDPGGCGGVQDADGGSPAETRQVEAEWDVATAQAQQVAKQRGTLPGAMERLVRQVLQPKVDWRDVLREFVSRHARNDYAWTPPNRRFIHQGLYLPSPRSEELGDIVLAVDTSGSIGEEELGRFASEAQGILDAYACTLSIVYHDAEVQAVERWQPSDGALVLHPVGGGGTDHRPVFAWVEQQGLTPTCMVCLTDLDSRFPVAAPAYPVLWAVAGGSPRSKAPFGIQVSLD